jgi:hypothetical protein
LGGDLRQADATRGQLGNGSPALEDRRRAPVFLGEGHIAAARYTHRTMPAHSSTRATKGTSRVGTRRKPAAKSARQKAESPRQAAKRQAAKKGKPVRLLSGGNPQIEKAEGDAPVQAYIDAMPGWKRDVGRRLDALIVRAVPRVRKAVKWNSPFYGSEGRGWFLAVHTFTHYVKVGFFSGASLRPLPPGASKIKGTRYIDIREGELDEVQMAKWVKQAATLPGWIA